MIEKYRLLIFQYRWGHEKSSLFGCSAVSELLMERSKLRWKGLGSSLPNE